MPGNERKPSLVENRKFWTDVVNNRMAGMHGKCAELPVNKSDVGALFRVQSWLSDFQIRVARE